MNSKVAACLGAAAACLLTTVSTGAAADDGNPDVRNGRWSPLFQNVEADNGQVYRVDLNSIRHFNTGFSRVLVCVQQGSACSPSLVEFYFDCHGRYMDLSNMRWPYVPSKSVVAQVSKIACGATKAASR